MMDPAVVGDKSIIQDAVSVANILIQGSSQENIHRQGSQNNKFEDGSRKERLAFATKKY
jgi:hypothetical protein